MAMALVHVNGHLYFTKSVRQGRKVTSYSYGPAHDETAQLFVQFDRMMRQERQIERMERRERRRKQSEARRAGNQEIQALRRRLDSTDRLMAGYFRRIGKTVETILLALGYHRHARGQWRRRRQPMSNLPATVSVAELVKLAREGDQNALRELRYQADRLLYETVEAFDGDLSRTVVEPVLVNSLGPGYHRNKEGVAAKLAILRLELAPPGSSVAEELLAERAALSWLHVMLLEVDRVELLEDPKAEPRKIAMIDGCLSRAQARMERALIALAKVRRLNLPVVINQVNVGAQVNGAVLTQN
jgi:hypothetical protein